MNRQRALIPFFVLAFALPWGVWLTTILEQQGALGWHVPSSLAFWLGLTVATYGVAALSGGWPAVRDLLVRLVRVRGPWWVWVLAAALTPATATVAALVGTLAGHPLNVGVEVAAAALPGILALNLWLFLITEETAWRGFALPRLQAALSPLGAAIVLGLIWGVWHLPLFFTRATFQARIPFVGFMLSILATSVIITWLFDRARGSVLLAAVFHAVTDVAIAYSGAMTSGATLFWTFVVVQCCVAIVLAAGMRGRVTAADAGLVYPPGPGRA